MPAQDIFEWIGFKKEETQEIRNGIITSHLIKFDKYVNGVDRDYHHYFDLIQKSYMYNFVSAGKVVEAFIPHNELIAVTKQMIELGWIPNDE